MRRGILSSALALLAAVVVVSCSEAPISSLNTSDIPSPEKSLVSGASVVISQIYGAGGNAGALYQNDYVELFNRGSVAASIGGMKLQYASTNGSFSTNNTVTLPATASIAPGHYYLVSLAGSTSNGVPLPVSADFSGSTQMSGSAGKVVLASAPVTGNCPTANVVDHVAFGNSAGDTSCVSSWGGRTGTIGTSTAATRKLAGCVFTNSGSNDFEVKTAAPRNSANVNNCPAVVSVTPASNAILPDGTVQLSAQYMDGQGNPQSTSFTWAIVGDAAVATVDGTGLVTGHGQGDVTVTATSSDNVVGSAQVHVGARPVVTVNVTPSSVITDVAGTQQFSAVGLDATNTAVAGTTFTWTSSSPNVTVSATGLATAVSPGDATITATSNNGVVGTAQMHVAAPVVFTGDVVISQVYGGGGNSGATYTNDFVELYNKGTQAQDVGGWKVAYASAAGTFSNGGTATLPAGASIEAGHYYLVQMSSNAAVGAPLPTPDATGSLAMGAGAGKIILTTPTASFAGATCPTGSGIIDYVGYGSSTSASACTTEWGGRTSDLSSTLSAFRANDGCIDTNSGSDWAVQNVNPRNSSSTGYKSCAGEPTRAASSATIIINELMGDPLSAAGGASWGEWFEVYNYGTQPVDLHGWKIISGGSSQPDHTIGSSVVVPAGGYAVLGRGYDPTRNGGIDLDYNYFSGAATTIWLESSDYLELVDGQDALVDRVQWTSMAHGVSKAVRDPLADNSNGDGSNWGYSTLTFGSGDYGTPGAANDPVADVAPALSLTRLSFSGRVSTDAPVPVGFEAQMFATELDTLNHTIATNISWEAVTPSIASVDEHGVLHGLAPGAAVFRATATDGTTRLNSVTIAAPVASATAQYGNNTEFGEPVDQQSRDSYIIRRAQYTTSYNVSRGIPNWVAYDLNATHMGGEDRCNCFTFDPELPASFPRYTTADYTGAGAYAGYGIDRGHMVRSFDRTTGTLDNAVTFYFDNVVPQAADLNQGPWAVEENYLGDLAKNQNKEVYIYVGPAGSKGTVKGEGKITIPDYTWKVALVLPRGKGLNDVQSLSDVQVVATVMPNVSGVRNVDWTTYETTVDSVEALTGYDLLAALPDNIEIALESNTHIPVAAINSATYSVNAHDELTVSGSNSHDDDADQVLTYSWNFGDGSEWTNSPTHTYSRSGNFTLQLIVTDPLGVADTASAAVHVADPTPAVITPVVTGTTGNNGWYVSNVGLTWNVTDPESDIASKTGCDAATYTNDFADQTITCSAVNGFGLTDAESVTIKRDASAPVVSYSGNLGTYSVADTTNITCSATDVGPSGVASTTCQNVNVPVYTLALGSHTYSATATDNAGNVGTGSTSFTVTVSTASLSSLTKVFVSQPGVTNALLQKLAAAKDAADRGDLNAKAGQLGAYINQVEAQRGKTISSANADLLIALAKKL